MEQFEIPDGKIPCDFCDRKMECLGNPEVDPKDCKIIFVNGEPKAIIVKPITFLCHRGDMKLHMPGVVEISAPETVLRARSLTQKELDLLHVCGVKELFDLVFASTKSIRMPKTIAELQREGNGVQHIVGMLTMLYEAVINNKQFLLRNPETFLHPSAQAGLGDMIVKLACNGKSSTT